VGNGSTKHLNANRAGNSDPTNNSHVAVYVTGLHSGSQFSSLLGHGAFSIAGSTFLETNTNWISFYSRMGSSFVNIGGHTVGFTGLSRNNSSSFTGRTNNTQSLSTPQNSAGAIASDMFVFANNNSGAISLTRARLAFYSIGESLTLATLDSRLTTLYNAIGAAIP
jgi:hypothetical protein